MSAKSTPKVRWTKQQRDAIETVDRSVLVSAAAGSGKTAVLAARCVYLVCDAPPPFRCDIDQILVVTFTEAAAAEMRSRIVSVLRQRALDDPYDRRARQQAAIADTARIGTLHSFCLSVIRDWFHRVDVDAAAQVLDAEEVEQLRTLTLEAIFENRYRNEGDQGDSFRQLVDVYGQGRDRSIAILVLKIANLCDSLIDSDAWLTRAADAGDKRFDELLRDAYQDVMTECHRQAAQCADTAAQIRNRFAIAAPLADDLDQLANGLSQLQGRSASQRSWDATREFVNQIRRKTPRQPRGIPDDEKDEWQRAKSMHTECIALFKSHLLEGLMLFSASQLREGFDQTAPFVKTLVELTREFREAYDATKNERGLLDFSDLERLAYRLLSESRDGEASSPVADELRQKYAHVLVDEFQDINPIQAQIIRQISRESLTEHMGNLFAVGDVKQSIYRFRLAEPRMFVKRQRDHESDRTPWRLIAMQTNFRSTPRLIDAINALFTALMTGEMDDVAYDDIARMSPGCDPDSNDQPCEVHLLERKVESGDDDDDDESQPRVDPDDPAHWQAAEREAFLIGRRIKELMESGFTVTDGDALRPMRFDDVGILLRSAKNVAARMGRMLESMGIPAWVDTPQNLFETTEVRCVLSALALIDNLHQDIELASVLRSGVLGERFSESELVSMRTYLPHAPFHSAVLGYSRRGGDPALRRRLRQTIRRSYALRKRARIEPVADIIWSLLTETGYLGWVSGLRDGNERETNLIALHDWARTFGAFRRQGLGRFLRFIDQMKERDQTASPANLMPAAQNAVRIMSVHRSKGLEFPVVFVAALGREFDKRDARGRMLLERDAGLGLKAVDEDRLIEYPTIAHHRCARLTARGDLAEEMRILYVALTRTRQKLILVGTERANVIEKWASKGQPVTCRVGGVALTSASKPLHWVVAAVASLPPSAVADGGESGDACLFVIRRHDSDSILNWSRDAIEQGANAELIQRVADCHPLPKGEPSSGDLTQARLFVDRLCATYPHLAVTSVRSAISASESDRITMTPRAWEQESRIAYAPPRSRDGESIALRRGNATHRILQWIDLDADDPTSHIDMVVQSLIDRKVLSEADVKLVDHEGLRWFLESELAQRARLARRYHREWMFLSSVPLAAIDVTASGESDERILVRGVVDGVVEGQDNLTVIDFKTDAISAEQADRRAQRYDMQVRLYARAASEAFAKPVVDAYLVFLAARHIVGIDVN